MADQRTGLQKFTAGGDLYSNELKLRLHNGGKIAVISAAAGVTAALVTGKITAGSAWPLFWRYNAARVLDGVGLGGGGGMLNLANYTPRGFLSHFGQAYHNEFLLSLPLSILAGVTAGTAAAVWFIRKFQSYALKTEDEYIRGTMFLTVSDMVKKVLSSRNGAGALTLAGIKLPKTALNQNMMFIGAQGSGKSQAIESILDQIAAFPEEDRFPWIVWSSARTEVATYYREGKDITLNPYDARSKTGWSIMNEIRPDFVEVDAEAIASAFSPSRGMDEKSAFFARGAAAVLADALIQNYRNGLMKNTDLDARLLLASTERVAEYLKGLPGANMLQGDGLGSSIQGTLTDILRKLRHMPDGDFCIRDFIQKGGDVRLFLHANEETIAAFQPIARTIISMAMRTCMTLKKSPLKPQAMFVLDEANSAGKIDQLQAAVTESRKYGIGVLLGCQSWEQINTLYGEADAAVILNGLQTKTILRVDDPKTQKLLSQIIGETEFLAKNKGTSWGPADSKDGNSQNEQITKREAVIPSELGNLADLEGFAKIVGVGTAKIKIDYVDRKRDENGEWVPRVFEKRLPGYAPTIKQKPDDQEASVVEAPVEPAPVKPAQAGKRLSVNDLIG